MELAVETCLCGGWDGTTGLGIRDDDGLDYDHERYIMTRRKGDEAGRSMLKLIFKVKNGGIGMVDCVCCA
jgi:hypothetical protein